MSEVIYKNIMIMLDNIDEHQGLVEERMREAGIDADPAMVAAIAKYWDALELLAAE